MWRAVFGSPIIIEILSLIVILLMFRNPSLKRMVAENTPGVNEQIMKVYSCKEEDINSIKK
jgi:hypothetical protein